jgi:hypothetical protein
MPASQPHAAAQPPPSRHSTLSVGILSAVHPSFSPDIALEYRATEPGIEILY